MLGVIRSESILGEGQKNHCYGKANVYDRIRNKAKLRPIDLVDPRNTELRAILQKAEFTMLAGDDIVQEDDDDEAGGNSASDSE